MKSMKRQRGITFFSLTIILIFLGFVGFIVLKVAPIYANSFTVKAALESLAADGLMDRSVANIHDKLSRRLQINSIDFIKRDNIHIAESGGRMIVEVNYVEQRKVVANLEVLATFSHQIEIAAN